MITYDEFDTHKIWKFDANLMLKNSIKKFDYSIEYKTNFIGYNK